MAEITNRFTSGMMQDSLMSLSNPETYRMARNAIHESRDASNFGLVNEESNELVATFGGKIKGYSHIEERNQTLYFISNGGSGEIWLLNHKDHSKQFVCSDAEFGCNWNFNECEFLYGEFKQYNKCNEMHVYWSSDCVFYVVNIDEMLNSTRKASVKACEDCTYFEVFQATCGPHLSAIPSSNNGSMIEAGVIRFAIQLQTNDGYTSNVFDVSQPVMIESEDNTIGQVGNTSAKLRIDGLDKKWNDVIVYVMHTVGGVTVTRKMPTASYGDTGFTYEYYGQKGEIVDISTVINKKNAWIRGKDLIQKDGSMIYYNIKNQRNLNYQKYANDIKVSWVEYEASMDQQIKYHFPSLMRGEVYAVGIVWKFLDGTYSDVYHIPATAGDSGGGDSGDDEGEIEASMPYSPINATQFDTEGQMTRDRGPEDGDGSSSEWEDVVRDKVNNFDTNKDDVVEAGECDDCEKTGEVLENDIDDFTQSVTSSAEVITGMGNDQKDPTITGDKSTKDAALEMLDGAVKEREYITYKAPTIKDHIGVDVPPRFVTEDKDKPSYRGDNWTDNNGYSVIENGPIRVDSGRTIPWESSVQYPDDKDCDGEHFYPQGAITHHQMPWSSERPHFISYQNGVVNKYQPHNYEFGKTFTRPMGLKLTNIKFPSEDELPKPLCDKSPYKIVYVQRTAQNKSVFSKGYLKGIFTGETYGEKFAYPRHAINSFEHVDRMIASGENGTSRMGEQSDEPIYTYHSPDTDVDRSFLPITKCRSELHMRGSGWRHGMYAKGKRPIDDQWSGTRIDNRGTRISNNLNHYTVNGVGDEEDVVGITFAPGNTIVSPTAGMQYSLMNRYRESSVYMELTGRMKGDDRDESFTGDVLDQFAPTKCNAPYVALTRELEDQYGSVEGLKYIDLGLMATSVHGEEQIGEIEGICGDIWIAPYTKRSTSYVSNKVGDYFNPPPKPGSICRERSWCDSPDDKIFEYMGINHYPTRLPKSGDKWDAKNYAGLHTVPGVCGQFGLSRPASNAATSSGHASESDFYGPRTLKSLNMTIVESHVNPWLRETGEGSQKESGKVWYPKTKDLYLDADAPNQHPWEDSFLTRFYCEVEQPSTKQLQKKAMIRTILNMVTPAALLTQFTELEGGVDTAGMMFIAPMLMAMWVLATNTLFTDKKLNEMLGIGDCRRDEEGGELDESIENWEDAYSHYNWDYSTVNDIQPYYAFPLPFNTCDCDECDKVDTTNTMYVSPKQRAETELDAYKHIRVNDFDTLPAHAGKLQKLFIQGNKLYGITTDGIWLIKVGMEGIEEGVAFQQSGVGAFLVEPVMIFEGVTAGYVGTEHPNAIISTPFGVFIIDDVAKKIYRFNGTPEEISAYGMNHFFKENLGFCEDKECYDEKTSDDVHYALGWDPRHNRLLVTKQDGSDCSSFTASYTPLGIPTQGGGSRGKWISFHDYKPQGYVWDRNNMYSILSDEGEVWLHHKKGEYGKFYGESHPFEVEFTATGQALEAFDFEYLTMNTEAEIDGKVGLDQTFNKVALWNSGQGTGTLPINVVSDNAGNRSSQRGRIGSNYSQVLYNKVRSMWQANGFKDLTIEKCEELNFLLKDCDCQVIPELNEELYDCNVIKSQNFANRTLSDKYLNFRYTLDNRNDMRLYVLGHKVYDNNKQIPK